MAAFSNLRQQMKKSGVTQADIAAATNRSRSYINQRLNGEADWPLQVAYKICQVCGIAIEDMPKYFPSEVGVLPQNDNKTQYEIGNAIRLLANIYDKLEAK